MLLLYLCLLIALLAWQIYLERIGATFILGLTWIALGTVGLIAGGIVGARFGLTGILVGALCGVVAGFSFSPVLAGLASGIQFLFKRGRGH